MIHAQRKERERCEVRGIFCNGDKIQRPNGIAKCHKNIFVGRWHEIQEAKMQEQEIVGMKGVLSGGQQKLKRLKSQ